jgi:predicted TIM-barrel fold metal-dependent hydrolase
MQDDYDIVDVNVFSGHWPFRRIPDAAPNGILRLMARTGTRTVLVTPLNAVFYRLWLDALGELVEAMATVDSTNLRLLAAVNPNFPDWEADLDLALQNYPLAGIRLFPNYHRYSLLDPATARLFARAAAANLPVMITARVQDERIQHPLMPVPAVPLAQIASALQAHPEVPIVVSMLTLREIDQIGSALKAHPNAAFELGYIKGDSTNMVQAIERYGAQRILYGTAMPLHYPESTLNAVMMAEISDADRAAILGENARKFFRLADVAASAGSIGANATGG